jgi:hypothetical protein
MDEENRLERADAGLYGVVRDREHLITRHASYNKTVDAAARF